MGTARRVRTFALGLAAILGCGLLPGIRVFGQEVESLLDQGLKSYEEGDYAAALAAFDEAFRQRPSNDLLAEWVDRVTVEMLVRMASEDDPRLAGTAVSILKGARTYRGLLNEDRAAIQAAVDATAQATGGEQLRLMIEYTNQFGRNVVPALIPLLGDSSLENQRLAFTWIARRIGRDAVPPLVAAWKHPDERIRSNIARLLGASGVQTPYSLAYLQAMVETDESEEVRRIAKESLGSILEANREKEVANAKTRFLRNAYDLYRKPQSNEFDRSVYTANVYELQGEQVIAFRVADFQLGERMAEQNLREAFALDPSYGPAHVLNLLNDAAQVVEYEHQTRFYETHDSNDGEKAILASQKSYIDCVVRLRALAAPTDVLYRALGEANRMGHSAVARYLIDRIRERRPLGDVPGSLVTALSAPESRPVRTLAAIAIAERNPKAFSGGKDVVSVLASAVVQSGIRTAVKAVGNKETGNRLQRLIEGAGMESRFELANASEAYTTVTNLPPDVIFVDENLRMDTQLAQGRAVEPVALFINVVRRDYRTASTPIIVVVSPERLTAAQQSYADEANLVWAIPSNIAPKQFEEEVIGRIFAEADDEKTEATRLAAAAAEALHFLARAKNSAFPVEESVDSLRLVLENRPSEVRIPCIRALGALGATAAIPDLAGVYRDGDSATDVRCEALEALARIASTTRTPVDAAVASIIREGTRSSDLALRRAAWMAFADAGLSPEDRVQLYASEPCDAAGSSEMTGPAAGTPAALEPDPFAEDADPFAEPADAGAPADDSDPFAGEDDESGDADPFGTTPEEDSGDDGGLDFGSDF